MDYIELKLTLNPYTEELSEILISELGDLGFDSFTETENGFYAYAPVNAYKQQQVAYMISTYKEQVKIDVEQSAVKTQNWNAVWESNFSPIIVDNRCVIRAPFHHDCPKLEFDIVIEPKMSFGTGHHDTTYLMAEWLLNSPVEELTVLDMGCGTGILAIIAALKNASSVDAIDIDEWPYENTIENAKVNGVGNQINAMLGDASLLSTQRYDLILANINRNILLQDIQRYTTTLKKGGKLVVSGIFTEDIPVIEAEAQRNGLRKLEDKSRNQWARVVFCK